MLMDSGDIKVTCKRCNRQAKAGEFVLDPYYRMMVCPTCVKERRGKTDIKPKGQETKPAEPPKPAGWDSDDDALEKMAKQKSAKAAPAVERIDADRIRYTCSRCKFRFVYQISRKAPSTCPYCGTPVMTSLLR
jgi:DNA-directed RNA polymerase subunit RPC12/RpoP